MILLTFAESFDKRYCIDGNASNNRRDNLRCICPNCDSQLDTYKSKNKNGARYYYRYKQG